MNADKYCGMNHYSMQRKRRNAKRGTHSISSDPLVSFQILLWYKLLLFLFLFIGSFIDLGFTVDMLKERHEWIAHYDNYQ